MTTIATASGSRTGRTRGPYRNGVRRREQILDTAMQVFGQHGYTGASLRMIAEMVGVSPAAVVRHFGSKEGLLSAVLEESDRSNAPPVLQDVRGLQYLRRVANVVETNVRNRGMVELLLTVATEASNAEHPARPSMVGRYQRIIGNLAAELRYACDAGEIMMMDEAAIDAEARGIAALMDGLEIQWLLDPDVDLVGVYGYHFEQMVARWQDGLNNTDGPGSS